MCHSDPVLPETGSVVTTGVGEDGNWSMTISCRHTEIVFLCVMYWAYS